ncbi:MAG: hypothetical protein E7137_01575 [Rikenellaceae bacterium]|nr:hypothetical protein [Rikenellaceae bacterium]
MKKLLLIALAVAGFCAPVEGQQMTADEVKSKINEIKRDQNYLYGENAAPTKEEAMEVAKDLLMLNIEEWLATQENTTGQNVVAAEVAEASHELNTMRGTLYRAFVFVKKSSIIPSAGEAEEVAAAPAIEPAPVVEATPAPAPAPALTAEEQAALAELNISEGAAAAIAAATATAGAEVATEAAATTMAVAPAPAVEPVPVAEPAPAPAVAAEPEPAPAAGFPIDELISLQTIDEVKTLLNNNSDKCAHGDVRRSMDMEMVGQALLIVYNISDGKIRTILDKKQANGKRVNYFSRYEDSSRNYKGCGAWWVMITK